MENFEKEVKMRRVRRRLEQTNSNRWTGILLLIIGSGLLLKNMDANLPSWLFRWEVAIVLFGIYIGVRQKFHGFVWFAMIALGCTSLLDVVFPAFERPGFTWAVVAILVGLFLVLRPKNGRNENWVAGEGAALKQEDDPSVYTGQERLDVTAIFGSVKKVVVSKSFKGGEIVSIMGGSEINFTQADINGRVSLEATNIMGGTKLIIPPTWDVQSEMVAIFGGVEDKRDVHALKVDPTKVLVLEGTCIFGGLEIRNY